MQLITKQSMAYREFITSRDYVDLIQDIINKNSSVINLGIRLLCENLEISVHDGKTKEELQCFLIFGTGLGYFEGFHDKDYIENCIIPVLRGKPTSRSPMDKILKENSIIIQRYIDLFCLNLNLIYNDRINDKLFELLNILVLIGYTSGVADRNQKSKA